MDAETREAHTRALMIAAIALRQAPSSASSGSPCWTRHRQRPSRSRPCPRRRPTAPMPRAPRRTPEQLGDTVGGRGRSRPRRCRGVAGNRRGRPVVLRCRTERPVDFVLGGPLQVIDPVQWLKNGWRTRHVARSTDRSMWVESAHGSGPTSIRTDFRSDSSRCRPSRSPRRRCTNAGRDALPAPWTIVVDSVG